MGIEKFPLAVMERALKQAGAQRVSEDAKQVLCDELFDIAIKIGKKASDIAVHGGRKTVKGDDIRLVIKSQV